MKKLRHNSRAGFTLVELMIAIASGSILLDALLAASVALQRSYVAVEAYAIAEGDQLRVQDYIAMDCRRATNITIDNGSWSNSGGAWAWVPNVGGTQTLMITLPAFYDSASKAPVAPFFDVNGKLQYGSGGVADTTTISYYKSGSTFVRQVGSDPTAAKPFGITAIANNVSTFSVTPLDQSATNGTVSCAITFAPSFTRLPGPGPIAGTTVYASTFLRNAQARQ